MLHVLMEYVMFWILSPYQEHNCQYQYKKLLDVVLFDTGGSIDLCFFIFFSFWSHCSTIYHFIFNGKLTAIP